MPVSPSGTVNFLPSIILLQINVLLITTYAHSKALLLIGLIIAPGVGLKGVSDRWEEEGAMLDVRQVAGEEEEKEESN